MNILEFGIAKGKELGREKGIKLGREEGIKQGIQQGMEQSTRSIVGNMLRHNVAEEKIRMYTGCGQELIDVVRDEMNKQ